MADAPIARLIGGIRGDAAGPTLIVVAGMHGNEPAGVFAAGRVLARLAADNLQLRGDLLVLAGNVQALALGRRFQKRDLNRQWSDERIALLSAASADPEAVEQRELHGVLSEALAAARGPVFFVDLHTTSAAGIPFAVVSDTMRHRAFASAFPVPVLLGLEEQIDGSLSEYLSLRGHVSLVVEGGQHAAPGSIDNLEAVCWLALDAAGLVARERLSAWPAAHRHLDRMRGSLPRLIEVLYRHGIAAADEFRMEPGFANIQRAAAGQLLARDQRGDIRAPANGLVLLPLYQPLGDDGFFFGREVPRWRQRLAALARRARLDRVLRFLPGVRRGDADQLDVSARAAELYPREIFHLFGYRRIRSRGAGERLVVSRSPQA